MAGRPGHKPAARRKKPAEQEKKRRKEGPHGFARTRMEPTRRAVHAPESCRECHTTLTGGWVQRTREVIEIPAAPVEVTEHVFMARTCPLCRKRRLLQEPLQGRCRGPAAAWGHLVSLIITLREEGRLPVRTIQWYLRRAHQLKLSVGAIVRTIHQAVQQAGPSVNEVLERIRCSPVVHADETGWRENGVNGYVWTFSTPLVTLTARPLRGIENVFAVDGTSWSTRWYDRWLDGKEAPESERQQWAKLHLLVGVKSNIIARAAISPGNHHDSPYYKGLITETAEHFDVHRVLADLGYSSRGNNRLGGELGFDVRIPFKSNTRTPADDGSEWSANLRLFLNENERFMAEYQLRSNVESTNGSVKAMQPQKLRCKSFDAQVNEALAF